MEKFSVLISVYKNDNPAFVEEALRSVITEQTLKPSEVVLVVDGPVPNELRQTISSAEAQYKTLKIYWQAENQGLGKTMNYGVLQCSHELIARMDADDISLPYRFEKEVIYLQEHPEISIVGGQISEFIGEPSNIVAYRNVPLTPEDCKKYFRDRDPLNHVTVMFRKQDILAAGNYQHWHLDEDTYLWGRVLKAGYQIANLEETLVNVRTGEDMYARRGGWKYFKSDSAILKWKLDNGFISRSRYCYNYLVRFTVQVLMPNSLRGFIFKHFLRKTK